MAAENQRSNTIVSGSDCASLAESSDNSGAFSADAVERDYLVALPIQHWLSQHIALQPASYTGRAPRFYAKGPANPYHEPSENPRLAI